MLLKLKCTILFSILAYVHVFAQKVNGFSIDVLPGTLFAHQTEIKHLESHVLGFQASAVTQWNKKKDWNAYYNEAETRYNLFVMKIGDGKVIGNAIALGANLTWRLYKKYPFYVRLGSGIGYLTKKFDVNSNIKNLAIGSHINGKIEMAMLYQVKMSKTTKLQLGLGLTHFSNGSIKVPNLGINMPTVFLSSSTLYPKELKFKANTISQKYRNEILINYGTKQRFTANYKHFNVVNIGYRYIIPIDFVKRIQIGLDGNWDQAHPYLYQPIAEFRDNRFTEMIDFGISGGFNTNLGKFVFLGDIGFYIYQPHKNKAFTYQRLGFRYHINNQLYINTTLKIHFGTADYFEWGLGYKFGRL